MLLRWRGVRASVWMLWLGVLAVATAGFVALLLLHSGSSTTGIPPSLQIARSGIPLSSAPQTSTTLGNVVSAPVTTATSPTVIVVTPRQPVSEGVGASASQTDGGSSGSAKSTTGSTVVDH